jgi:phosphohistidine phosphatase
MLLYLLRHAEASPYQADDFSRRLTEKGIKQARRVGEFLLDHKIKPDLTLTSPVLRAKETAEIVAGKIKANLTVALWISCGMSPETALSELSAYAKLDSVMIVGHEPDFSTLIATLLGMESSAAINVSKASLTALNVSHFTKGGGVLRFLLPVSLL